jgi:hypothetical protein
VLIASQAHATQAIAEFLVIAASANPDCVFTLKQHPQEAPVNFGPNAPANLVLADPAANTLDLLARSEFVLGVYTTALFEAFALGCKVGVLAFSGWQHIRGLVESGDAQLIENQNELTGFLAGSNTSGSNLADANLADANLADANPALASGADYYYAQPVSEVDLWAAIKIAQ